VTGLGPHENVTVPPALTAATTAAEVQLAGVPVPTTCAEAQVGAATDAHTTRAVRRIFVLMGPGSTRRPRARRLGRPTGRLTQPQSGRHQRTSYVPVVTRQSVSGSFRNDRERRCRVGDLQRGSLSLVESWLRDKGIALWPGLVEQHSAIRPLAAELSGFLNVEPNPRAPTGRHDPGTPHRAADMSIIVFRTTRFQMATRRARAGRQARLHGLQDLVLQRRCCSFYAAAKRLWVSSSPAGPPCQGRLKFTTVGGKPNEKSDPVASHDEIAGAHRGTDTERLVARLLGSDRLIACVHDHGRSEPRSQ
jgi:hypothetical protein